MLPKVLQVGDGVFSVGEERARTAWAAAAGTTRWVFLDGIVYVIEPARGGSRPRRRGHSDTLSAPMPATVRKISVKQGENVQAGQVLIVLEAMKMELPVRAPASGVVTAVHCSEGELVQPGVTLATLEE